MRVFFLLLIGLLVTLPATCLACADPGDADDSTTVSLVGEIEPNDSPENATPLTPGTVVQASISRGGPRGDSDVFQCAVPESAEPTRFRIEVVSERAETLEVQVGASIPTAFEAISWPGWTAVRNGESIAVQGELKSGTVLIFVYGTQKADYSIQIAWETPTAKTLGEDDKRTELQIDWSTAGTLPAADSATMADTLLSYGLHMLLPSQMPTGAGPASSRFLLYRTPATGLIELYVQLETENNAMDLFISSASSQAEVYRWLPQDIPGSQVMVRGQQGMAFPFVEQKSLPMIIWKEEGQCFIAMYRSLSVDLTVEDVAAWLDSCYLLP
jgi:hypothetical protein